MLKFAVTIGGRSPRGAVHYADTPEQAAADFVEEMEVLLDGPGFRLLLDADEVIVYRPDEVTLGADLVTTVGQVRRDEVTEADWTPSFRDFFHATP